MHPSYYSSMLPNLFRHKTTKVRIGRPQVILLDFHGTISERRWEDKVIYPYVRKALGDFLRANWSDETVQRCLPALRDESFEQRFRNRFDDAPVISDQVDGEDERDRGQLANQMGEFLLWQMGSKKETNETQLIERLVWRDGLRRRQIVTPIYEDVFACVRDWHEKSHCAIYVISSLDPDTLKLLFENTDCGNLRQFFKGFVSPKKSGDKLSSELYRNFYDKLHLDKDRASSPKSCHEKGPASSSSPPLASALKTISRDECSPRPVLFLTDSGQEARAASQVSDGAAFECVLVNRPGNKRFRTFYLSQFAYIERFDDITFVD